MNKYKVCVYAISKNEEKFVDRWYNSMKEADAIYVLDTSSEDNTVKLLKERGVVVFKEEIIPFRFDKARNRSLELIPNDYDIYVCTDLDEVFEKGWRKELEKHWQPLTTRCRYNYNWSLDKNNTPLVNFYTDKIHIKEGYKWIYPVHEVLSYNGKENIITIDNIVLNHYPDKTKSRSNYLNLLKLSIKENPNDDRGMHYLGREYLYHQEYEKCISTLKKHLSLPSATWKDERAASMRFIARSYINLNKINEGIYYYKKAISEAPYLRDAYVELAKLEYDLKNYTLAIEYLTNALKITYHSKNYINEPFSWDSTIYDLLSICLYNTKRYKEALFYINKAIDMDSKNERLQSNRKIIEIVM